MSHGNSLNSSKAKNSSSRKKASSEGEHDHGFTIGRVLGEGSYSEVRSAVYDGRELAVKVITRDKLSKDFSTKFLPREIEIMSKVRHENIVKVYKIFNCPKKVYILMDLISDDLLAHIQARGRLCENEARHYFGQLISAIKYLHGLNIAHRDLKCDNIMMDASNNIKLIDFGFSRRTVDANGHRKLSETYCGSSAYAAPEVLQGRPYDPMMYDVWSLGCVLYIMVTGKMPFDDSNVKKMVDYQLKGNIEFPPDFNVSDSLKDLIKHILEPNVKKRFTLESVSGSKWFTEEGTDDNDASSRRSRQHGSKSRRFQTELVSTGTQVNISDCNENSPQK